MSEINFKQYFEVQSNDGGNPCFFMDYYTEELIYMNQTMEKKFQIFENYTGKYCQDVIPNYQQLRGYKNKEQVKMGEYEENIFLCDLFNANLRSKTTLIEVCGRKFIQTKYFLAPTDEKRHEAEKFFEKAISRCLEILNESNLHSSIDSFLQLLGEFYACELAYICEFDREHQTLSHRYFWSKDNNVTEIPAHKETVTMNTFIQWLENDHNKSVINLDKSEHNFNSDGTEERILNQYDIQNITLSKLWNQDGSLMGIVGLSNRVDLMYDDRLLQAVSHFVMERFNEKSMVKALENLNERDLLTGFYNRSKYAEKIVELQENLPKSLGVLFINLNGLRKTNEYLGYEEGDAHIKKASTLLSEYFRSEFFRITGDEFVGFVPDCEKEEFEKNVNALQSRLKEKTHESTFSFGHSWDSGGYTVSNLIKIADTVMVINKQSYYYESLKDMEEISNSMMKDLFQGIADDEFFVYLQAQVDLSSREVIGAEALIRRFDKKQQKMIFPDQFISLYEENSIIRHIDLFVVRQCCKMLRAWGEKGVQLQISVNLSRVTLMEHGIVSTICSVLDEYKIPHHLIVIEVTERIGLIENDVASTLVDEFKEHGFKLSLDDFGCAYSNIVTLATISVDEVKIDKSLVDHVLTNRKNRVIVKNMLSMCLELEDTHTLAEGIETQEQADFLREANCHYGQGYLYSRPIPHEEFYEKYVKSMMKK